MEYPLTVFRAFRFVGNHCVLILVLMEYPLTLYDSIATLREGVLILVLMEYPLTTAKARGRLNRKSLNPCSNGIPSDC